MFRKNNTAPKRRLDRSFLSRIRRKTTGILTFTIIIATALIFFSTDTHGATVAWDGGGATNNWSECANWVGDICPTSADVATFDGTSTKDATIDSDITVLGIDINMGYTGTMSMDDVFTITIGSSGYTQDDGIFNAQWATIDINDGSFTLNTGATFDGTGAFIEVEKNITFGTGINLDTTGLEVIMDGGSSSDDGSLTCSVAATLSPLEINKTDDGANVVIGTGCTVELGNSPITSGGTITNNGTIDVGTGTWTVRANISQTSSAGSIVFLGTQIAIEKSGNYFFPGYFTLTNGSFTATSLTSFSSAGNVDNSAGLLPSGLDFTLIAYNSSSDSTVTCNGNESFNSFNINKTDDGAYTTLGSECIIDLGNNPTIWGDTITNNGTLTVGTGTWTLYASFTQSSASASTTFLGTIIDQGRKNNSYHPGSFTLTNGSFTATSLTSLTSPGDINNSAGLLPSGLDFTLTAYNGHSDATITCNGNESFNSFNINKTDDGAYTTLGSECIIDLGNNPTIWGDTITNNGTLTVGTGTWTLYASFTQSSASASTTFLGTIIDQGRKNNSYHPGSFTLTNGSFTATSLTSLTSPGDINNSAGLLPSGLDFTLTAYNGHSDATITCNGNESFNSFNINKTDDGAYTTLGSECIIDLGNNAVVKGSTLTNNGTLTVGTGTWTLYADFVQNSSGASTTFLGTIINQGRRGNNFFSSSFSLTDGQFVATSLTNLTSFGSINNSSGLLPSGVDVTLGSYNDYSDGTFTCGDTHFGTIIINATSSGAHKKMNGDCIIEGDFTRTDGVVLNSDSASSLTVQGDLSISSADTFGGTNLPVKLTGTNSQNLSQTSSSFLSTFEIDKSSGIVTQTGDVSTNGTVCDITSGTLFTNGYDFTCGSTFTVHNTATLAIIGTESLAEPILDAGSIVEYKGDGDGLVDNYGIKDWSYQNLSINLTDSQDAVKNTEANTLLSGIVGYWPMDEASGTNVADDSGVNDLTAANGASVVSGRLGNAREFDSASSQYLISTNNVGISGSASRSISLWLKPGSTQGNQSLFDWGVNSSGRIFGLKYDNTNEGIYFWGSYNDQAGSTDTITRGAWNHILVTYDGTIVKTYIDGSATPDISATKSLNTTDGQLNVGGNSPWGGDFSGAIDDLRIYDRVLRTEEIASLGSGELDNGVTIPSLSIANNFTLSGGTFVSPATMNVGGYFVNGGGTFDANSGTVVLNGTNQIVSGDNTFNNITKQVASADTLTFGAGTTQTVEGTLTLNGASGQLLSLRSSNISNQWNIDPQGTRTLDFLDVQDSNNTNALAIDTGSFTYTDSGNNTNWGTAAAVQAIGRVVCVDDQGTWTNTMIGTGANDIKILVSDQSQSYSVTYGQTEVSYPESTYSFNLGSGSNYYDISLDIPEVVELDDGSFINASDLTSIDGYGVATNACPNNYYNQAGAFPSAYADPFFSNYQDPYFCENINESGAWVDGNGDPYAGQCSGDVADSYNNCLITDDPEGVSHLNFYFEGCDTSGKIVNADPEVEVVLQTDETMDVKTVKQVGTKTVRVKKSGKVIVDAPVDFSSTRDWTDVVADTEGNKSVVHFTGNSGHTTTHTIYAPMGSTTEFRACPQATTLGAVNTNCSNGVLFQGPYPEIQTVGVDTVTVTTEEIEGTTYWKASGLSGSGGEGENPPTEKFADGQWTRNTGVDTIIFENTIDMAAGDKILLTWDIGVDLVATTVTDATVDGTSSIVTTSQTTNTAEIIIPAGGMLAGSHTIVGTFLETYDYETYTAHTVGINTVRSNDESVGYGIAIIYEDNTVDVTAGVPQYLNMTLSKSTIDLGVLSTGAVNRDSHSITVYSNDGNGYTISVKSDGGLTDGTNNITPIPEDGTVVEGLESYGVAVLADAAASELGDFADVGDTPLPSVAKEEIVGNTARASGHIHTITYSASISSSTIAGIYTQTVTYTIASNL